MKKAVLHHYNRLRAHQMSCANSGGGMLTRYESGRTELSFGGAAYGFHAVAAHMGAKRHLHFVADLSATVKKDKRRAARRRKAK